MSTGAAKKIRKPNSIKKEQEKEKEEDFEPDSWECSVCTYRNQFAAFKCEICDTRKGTSTRKPRLNPSVVQQQTLVQTMAVQQTLAGQQTAFKRQTSRNSPESSSSVHEISTPVVDPVKVAIQNRLLKRKPVQFKDVLVVRSAAKKKQVTANGVTFSLTEFKARISPRGRKKISSSPSTNHIPN